MTAISRDALKLLYETGDRPTQSNFADLIDSPLVISASGQPELHSSASLQAGTNITLTQTGSTIKIDATGGGGGNILINGGFDFAQRQAPATLTSIADDVYCADRWYALTQTAAIQYARAAGDTNSQYAGQLKQNQAGAQRVGIAQIVEATNSLPFRGRSVRFQFRAKSSTTTALRAAILEWTGTADSVTSDVVNDWTTATYTAGNFFLAANLTITAVMASTNATTSYADFSVTGTLGNSVNNLIIIIWTEGTAAQNVTVDITQAGLYDGKVTVNWLPRQIAEELSLCQRYYEKSFSIDVAPANGNGDSNYMAGFATTTTVVEGQRLLYKVQKRATAPTLTYFRSSLSTTDNQWSAYTGAWQENGTTTSNATADHGFSGTLTVAAAPFTAFQAYILSGHWTSAAEL